MSKEVAGVVIGGVQYVKYKDAQEYVLMLEDEIKNLKKENHAADCICCKCENEKLKAEIEELKKDYRNDVKTSDRVKSEMWASFEKENQALRELVKGFVDLDGITFPARKKELMDRAKEILG